MTNSTTAQLEAVCDAIDSRFGKGHARQHPELVAACMQYDAQLREGIHKLVRGVSVILEQQRIILERLGNMQVQPPVAGDADQLELPSLLLVQDGPANLRDWTKTGVQG